MEDVDPALADWLKVDARQAAADESETESESDVDSLNDDVGKDIDEWIDVQPSGSESLESFRGLVSPSCPHVDIGSRILNASLYLEKSE